MLFPAFAVEEISIRKNSIWTCQPSFFGSGVCHKTLPSTKRCWKCKAHNYNLWNVELQMVKFGTFFLLFATMKTKIFRISWSFKCVGGRLEGNSQEIDRKCFSSAAAIKRGDFDFIKVSTCSLLGNEKKGKIALTKPSMRDAEVSSSPRMS